jgi:hypothetical protein
MRREDSMSDVIGRKQFVEIAEARPALATAIAQFVIAHLGGKISIPRNYLEDIQSVDVSKLVVTIRDSGDNPGMELQILP